MKRSMTATEAARTIAQELGQNPDSKGTARLAEALAKCESWTVQNCGRDYWIDTPTDDPMVRRDICRLSFGNPDNAQNAKLIAASKAYYNAAEAIRAYVVAADRVDSELCTNIPSNLLRDLLDAHRLAYA